MDWLRPGNFSRSERAWIAGVGLLLALASTLPYLIFASLTPEGRHYTWVSAQYYDDYFQYFAWARRVAGGDWLIRNYYTADPDGSFALFNPFFLLLGWIQRVVGSPYGAYHLLRVAAVGAFAWVSYAFVALFLAEIHVRRLAQLLMLGGGMEYPCALFFGRRPVTPLADPYVFKILYRYGHLTAALCLLLLIFGCYLAARRSDEAKKGASGPMWRPAAAVGLFTFVLGLINPYYLALVIAVLGAHAIWMAARKEWSPLVLAVAAAAGAALAGLQYLGQSIAYHLESITFDDPIDLGDLLLFFTILLPCAAAGWWAWRRSPQLNSSSGASLSFIAIWTLVVIALTLSPVAFRARMVLGLGVGLSIGAAAWLGRGSLIHPRAWLIYALLSVEIVFTFYKERVDFLDHNIGTIDDAMVQAMAFLDDHAETGDVVLTLGETGNLLPAYARVNTFVGHSFQTDDYAQKNETVLRFFAQWDRARRLDYMKEIGARYVLIGPLERAIAPGLQMTGLNAIYDRDRYAIYERTPRPAPQ